MWFMKPFEDSELSVDGVIDHNRAAKELEPIYCIKGTLVPLDASMA